MYIPKLYFLLFNFLWSVLNVGLGLQNVYIILVIPCIARDPLWNDELVAQIYAPNSSF